MNWYKTAQHPSRNDLHGQWWIIDGEAIKVGYGEGRWVHGAWAMDKARDMVYAQDESVVRVFADALRDAGVDIDEVKARAKKEHRIMLVSEIVDEALRGMNYGREEDGELPKGSHLHEEIDNALKSHIDGALLKASRSTSAAENWLIDYGAIKVSSHNIEMKNITSDRLMVLARAMEKVLPNISDESTANIEATSSRKYFIEIPWGIIKAGNAGGIWAYESK